MATMSVTMAGMDIFEHMATNSPKDLKAACNAGGEAARKRITQVAKSMGINDTGETAANPEVKSATKHGNGYACYITWKGNHSGKQKKPRRRAEVAFVNEYGTSHNKARPFNERTVTQYGDEIAEAMEKALPKY